MVVLKRTEICLWWGGGEYLYNVILVSSQLSEVPLVWAELLVLDELLVPEGMVVLVVDSDVPSLIRVVWSFRGGPRWGPRSCAMYRYLMPALHSCMVRVLEPKIFASL